MGDAHAWLASLEAILPLALSSFVVPAMLFVLWDNDVPGTKPMVAGHAILLLKRLAVAAVPATYGWHVALLCWEVAAYIFFAAALVEMERGLTRWRQGYRERARADADAAVAQANELLMTATRTMRDSLRQGVGHANPR